MEYICTTCCKDKRKDSEPLPAIERYLSRRIDYVHQESIRLNRSLLILSGKYGFIPDDYEIPWYDLKLTPEQVETLLPALISQLKEKQVTAMIFYGRPRTTPGWQPYYDALERSCKHLGITVEFKHTDLE